MDYEIIAAEIRPRWLDRVLEARRVCEQGIHRDWDRVFLGCSQADMSEGLEAEKSRGDPETPETWNPHSWKAFYILPSVCASASVMHYHTNPAHWSKTQ